MCTPAAGARVGPGPGEQRPRQVGPLGDRGRRRLGAAPAGSLGAGQRLVRRHGGPRRRRRRPGRRAGRPGRSSGDRGGDQHLLGAARPARPAARDGRASSSANTSSRISTGSPPSRGEQVVGRQPQRQREGPGLAVTRVALGRHRAELEAQLVAVRADQGDPALELGLAAGLPSASSSASASARGRGRAGRSPSEETGRSCSACAALRRDRRVGLATSGRGRSTSTSRAASSSAPAVARCASQTSRVDRSAPPRVARRHGRRLEQGVALLEDPVVVGAHAGQPRGARHEQVVEEPAPLATGRPSPGRGPPARTARCAAGRAPRGAAGPGERLMRARFARPGLISTSTRVGRSSRTTADPDDRALGALRGPAARRRRPGGCSGSRRSRSPRRGWSCPGRCGPTSDGDARVERELDRRRRTEVGQREVRDVHGAGRWAAGQPERRTGISR